MSHGDRFIALIFNKFAQIDNGHGHIEIGDTAVSHGGVVAEVGSFFHAAETSPLHPERHGDNAFALGHNLTGIHLDRRTFPAFNITDGDGIGAHFKGFLFHFKCRSLGIAQVHRIEVTGHDSHNSNSFFVYH